MDEIHQAWSPWTGSSQTPLNDGQIRIMELKITSALPPNSGLNKALHEKEQAALAEKLNTEINVFCTKEIASVEDTYTIKDQYSSITSQLPLLDDGELRAELLDKTEKRYDYFNGIIARWGMRSTI